MALYKEAKRRKSDENDGCSTEEQENGILPVLSRMYLENDEFKDVKFVVGSQSFMAHRCVIATQSDVFKAMLSHETREKIHGVIEIKDTSTEVFRSFLKYLYTNKIDEIEILGHELMIIADKYNVQSLREQCERYVSSKVDQTNAIPSLIESHLYNFKLLKNSALTVINRHLTDISHSDDFKLLDPYPQLYREIFGSIAKNRAEELLNSKKDDSRTKSQVASGFNWPDMFPWDCRDEYYREDRSVYDSFLGGSDRDNRSDFEDNYQNSDRSSRSDSDEYSSRGGSDLDNRSEDDGHYSDGSDRSSRSSDSEDNDQSSDRGSRSNYDDSFHGDSGGGSRSDYDNRGFPGDSDRDSRSDFDDSYQNSVRDSRSEEEFSEGNSERDYGDNRDSNWEDEVDSNNGDSYDNFSNHSFEDRASTSEDSQDDYYC